MEYLWSSKSTDKMKLFWYRYALSFWALENTRIGGANVEQQWLLFEIG